LNDGLPYTERPAEGEQKDGDSVEQARQSRDDAMNPFEVEDGLVIIHRHPRIDVLKFGCRLVFGDSSI
jgi:hypothetical protein